MVNLLSVSVVIEYYLVYWEDEGSVTGVPVISVDNGMVGERRAVKQGKDIFEGKLIYSGKQCVSPAAYMITLQNTSSQFIKITKFLIT